MYGRPAIAYNVRNYMQLWISVCFPVKPISRPGGKIPTAYHCCRTCRVAEVTSNFYCFIIFFVIIICPILFVIRTL